MSRGKNVKRRVKGGSKRSTYMYTLISTCSPFAWAFKGAARAVYAIPVRAIYILPCGFDSLHNHQLAVPRVLPVRVARPINTHLLNLHS